MTSAVPEASSSAASPQPIPSMWAPTTYISSGRVEPIFVQYTSSRGPGALGCELSSRRFASGCASGESFTLVGAVTPRNRAPPAPGRISPLTITGLGAAPCCGRDRGGGGSYTYFSRSVAQPKLFSWPSIQSTAARLRSVPWRRSPNAARPLIVALYLSRSSRPTSTLTGSSVGIPWPSAGGQGTPIRPQSAAMNRFERMTCLSMLLEPMRATNLRPQTTSLYPVRKHQNAVTKLAQRLRVRKHAVVSLPSLCLNHRGTE